MKSSLKHPQIYLKDLESSNVQDTDKVVSRQLGVQRNVQTEHDPSEQVVVDSLAKSSGRVFALRRRALEFCWVIEAVLQYTRRRTGWMKQRCRLRIRQSMKHLWKMQSCTSSEKVARATRPERANGCRNV